MASCKFRDHECYVRVCVSSGRARYGGDHGVDMWWGEKIVTDYEPEYECECATNIYILSADWDCIGREPGIYTT